jgi:hypothetical protein
MFGKNIISRGAAEAEQALLQALFGTLSKRLHWKNYKFILLIFLHNIFFIVNICYQLPNKTRNLLFAIKLLIYVIYGETISVLSLSLLTY